MMTCKVLSLAFLIMLALPLLLPVNHLDLKLCNLLVALEQVHISAFLVLIVSLCHLWPSVLYPSIPYLLLKILLLHFFLCLPSLLCPQHHLLCSLCSFWFLRMPHFLLLLLHPQFAWLIFPTSISLNLVILLVCILLFFMARMGCQLRLLSLQLLCHHFLPPVPHALLPCLNSPFVPLPLPLGSVCRLPSYLLSPSRFPTECPSISCTTPAFGLAYHGCTLDSLCP